MSDVRESTRSALGTWGLGEGEGQREWWVFAAYGLLGLTFGCLLYLGARPAGQGPIWVFLHGRLFLGLAGLLLLAIAIAVSALRRPFLRPSRVRAFFALALVIGTINYPFPFPSRHERNESLVDFEWPVEGEWTVVWGGEPTKANLLARTRPDRRWGLDLVLLEDGRSHRGEGTRAEDYHAFDAAVLAPAAGRVVAAVDDVPDREPPFGRGSGEEFGNHLVIEVAEGQYCFLAHLREGSITVSVGEEVVAGQGVARVGSSGHSAYTPEPHLALHLQDDPAPRRGQAIPWRFHGLLIGGRKVDPVLPRGGVEGGRFVGQRVAGRAGRDD